MLLKAISQPIEEDAAEDVDENSGHKIHGYISTRPFDGFSYYFMLKHAIPGTHIFVELGVVAKGIGKGKGQVSVPVWQLCLNECTYILHLEVLTFLHIGTITGKD